MSAIIVNADDFGLTADTNRAIKKLAESGAISSTSVMANLPLAEEVKTLANGNFRLGIGIHLNLTTGKPLTIAPSLTDANGNFFPLRTLVRRVIRVSISEIRLEIKAQLTRAQALTEGKIDHWDSHEGIHRYEPFASITLALCRDFAIRGMRNHQHYFAQSEQPILLTRPDLSFGMKRVLREQYYAWLSWRGRQHYTLPHGLLSSVDRSTLDLLKGLAEGGVIIGDNIWELPCHPALSFDDMTKAERQIDRVSEYNFLMSSDWRESVEAKRVKLITFREIMR